MTNYISLFYLCQIAGILVITYSAWLIWKQKITFDEQSQTTELEIPHFGKMRTNTPALVLFMLAGALLILPVFLVHSPQTQYRHIQQDIKSNVHPVLIYAAVNTKSLPAGDGRLDLPVPIVNNDAYSPELIYIAGSITDVQGIDLTSAKQGLIVLQPKVIQGQAISVQKDVNPAPADF